MVKKEGDDMVNLLSLGVKLVPNLVTSVEDLTNSPVNTATCRAKFSTSRSVETCIRGCQNYSFLNPQDILNILPGSLLETEQGENQTDGNG